MEEERIVLDRGHVLGILMTLGADVETAIHWIHSPMNDLMGWSPNDFIVQGRTDEIITFISILMKKEGREELPPPEDDETETP